MHNMRRITRFEVCAVDNDIYLENGEVRITNPDIKVCLACDVGDLENKTEEIILHQKYKRCLAMADFCESQHDYYNTLGNGFWLVRGDIEKRDEYRKKASDFWWKWYKRWRKFAEKFKEAK